MKARKFIQVLLVVFIMIASLVVPILACTCNCVYDQEEGEKDCTTAIAVGEATADGRTRVCQSRDLGCKSELIVRMTVDDETGIKVIGMLNSEGVGAAGNGIGCVSGAQCDSDTYIDKDSGYRLDHGYIKEDYPDYCHDYPWLARSYILRKAHSAEEALELATDGLPPGSWEITGPIEDAAFGAANAFIGPYLWPLRRNPADRDKSVRGERAQQLLDERLGAITTPWMFRIMRDHDLYEYDLTVRSDSAGHIARRSYRKFNGGTCYCFVNEIHPKYTDMLSVYWTTINWPLISPFLPFFIGLPAIPPPVTEGDANKTVVFQELLNAVAYNMDVLPKVQQFWESFEFETLREIGYLETKVIALVDADDRESAEQLLYDFCNGKVELAITYAEMLTKKVIEDSLIKVDVKVSPWQPEGYNESWNLETCPSPASPKGK